MLNILSNEGILLLRSRHSGVETRYRVLALSGLWTMVTDEDISRFMDGAAGVVADWFTETEAGADSDAAIIAANHVALFAKYGISPNGVPRLDRRIVEIFDDIQTEFGAAALGSDGWASLGREILNSPGADGGRTMALWLLGAGGVIVTGSTLPAEIAVTINKYLDEYKFELSMGTLAPLAGGSAVASSAQALNSWLEGNYDPNSPPITSVNIENFKLVMDKLRLAIADKKFDWVERLVGLVQGVDLSDLAEASREQAADRYYSDA